jgi:Kef-type K+ transport system membrane component KefB
LVSQEAPGYVTGVESERIIFELFVIFAAAKLAGEVFERIHQPPVVGEILVGIALGGHALGVIRETEVNIALQQLGAITLLFMVGLDISLQEAKEVGARALTVGSAGIVLPFLAGAGFIYAVAGSVDQALFMGAAMVATSVGITARVLADLGVLREVESRIILGAAVVDDVLGLLVLALVSGLGRGSASAAGIAALATAAIGFVVIVAAFGTRIVGALAPRIDRAQIERGELAAALTICLGLSVVAGAIGLAAIVGAFLAGMAFSETRARWQLHKQFDPVYHLLVPFFFVVTGARVDPGLLVDPATVRLVVVVTALAILGKVVGCGGAAWGMGATSMWIIGVGMVPRGEVGLIVASVGLTAGVVTGDLYGVVVAMSILTTLVSPPVLKLLISRRPPVTTPSGPREDGREGLPDGSV